MILSVLRSRGGPLCHPDVLEKSLAVTRTVLLMVLPAMIAAVMTAAELSSHIGIFILSYYF